MAKTQNARSEFMTCIILFLWISIIILFFPLAAKGKDGYLKYEIVFQDISQSHSRPQEIQGTVKRGGVRTNPTEGSPAQTPSPTDKTYSQLKEKKVTSTEGLETWTLTVIDDLTGDQHSTNTSGSATIKIDKKGNLSGSGNIIVTMTSSDPRYSPATGQGPFTLTGKREGDYLVLYFDKGNIICKGTRTYDTKTEPYERSYDTYLGSGIVIKRKEGGTSTTNLKVSEVTHTVTYSLSGGQNVVKTRPPLQDVSPKKGNIWTLEFERILTTPYGAGIEQGGVEFTIQSGGGPVRAEGPMTVKGVGQFMKGVLMLDGKVEKNILTFILHARIQTIHGPDGLVVSDYGEGQWWYDDVDPVSIPVKNGAEVTKDFSTPSTQSKLFFWLKAKKAEHY